MAIFSGAGGIMLEVPKKAAKESHPRLHKPAQIKTDSQPERAGPKLAYATLEAIRAAVTRQCNVSEEQILATGIKSEVVYARRLGMLVASHSGHKSPKAIGGALGIKTTAYVRNAIFDLGGSLTSDKKLKADYEAVVEALQSK